MFFGLTNSLATFQMMMNTIFAEEVREGWLTIYMDDMLIHTPEDVKLHCCCVHRILDKLRKHDLFLKPEKCRFEQKTMEFLGVVDKPTTTCARCTGNGSTLGPLGKRLGVGANPAPRRDIADLPDLPKSETSAVSESAGPLWPGSARNEKTSEKQKVGKSETERKCLL